MSDDSTRLGKTSAAWYNDPVVGEQRDGVFYPATGTPDTVTTEQDFRSWGVDCASRMFAGTGLTYKRDLFDLADEIAEYIRDGR